MAASFYAKLQKIEKLRVGLQSNISEVIYVKYHWVSYPKEINNNINYLGLFKTLSIDFPLWLKFYMLDLGVISIQ